MIRTKDLEAFVNSCIVGSPDFAREHYHEITKRLRAYDRICRDLEQLIATLSNVVDKGEIK